MTKYGVQAFPEERPPIEKMWNEYQAKHSEENDHGSTSVGEGVGGRRKKTIAGFPILSRNTKMEPPTGQNQDGAIA